MKKRIFTAATYTIGTAMMTVVLESAYIHQRVRFFFLPVFAFFIVSYLILTLFDRFRTSSSISVWPISIGRVFRTTLLAFGLYIGFIAVVALLFYLIFSLTSYVRNAAYINGILILLFCIVGAIALIGLGAIARLISLYIINLSSEGQKLKRVVSQHKQIADDFFAGHISLLAFSFAPLSALLFGRLPFDGKPWLIVSRHLVPAVMLILGFNVVALWESYRIKRRQCVRS